jgi:hypothetical protein
MSLKETFIKDFNIEKIKLSPSSLNLLNKIIQSVREIQIPKIQRITIENIIRGKMWIHIPQKIREKIETLNTSSLYRLSIHKKTFQIYFFGGSLKEHNQSIVLIYKYLFFILPYCPIHCGNDLIVYIYFSREKKTLPNETSSIIDVINVNSAFTTSCVANTLQEITIFRKEEWFKVFIHETFHVFGLDFSGMSSINSDKYLRENFHLLSSGNYRIYESYCEISAEVLNILFYVSITERNLEECLSLEKTFSLFQWKKILDYNGVDAIDLTHYRENSSVFSYYGLKSVGLYFLDDFIRNFWITDQRDISFVFKKTQLNIMEYCRFFGERFYKKKYLQSLSSIKNTTNEPLKKSLRMTLIEI